MDPGQAMTDGSALATFTVIPLSHADIAPPSGNDRPLSGSPAAATSVPAGAPVATADHDGTSRGIPTREGFVATLVGTLVFFISLAAIITVAIYVVELPAAGAAWDGSKHVVAPLLGTLAGLLGALGFARFNLEYAQPSRVDPRVYGEFLERLGTLDGLLPVLCPETGPATCDFDEQVICQAACNEARARRTRIEGELASFGSRWVLGSGYIDLWRQLHAAEEALFIVQPFAEIVGNGLFDEMRLQGAATIQNRVTLESRLDHALTSVGAPRTLNAGGETGPAVPSLFLANLSVETNRLGRLVLRDVRRAINQYRDGERANLIRAHHQLAWTGTFTAVAGYTLLVLAIVAQAPPEAIIAGATYYLVGAIVGLVKQLNSDRNLEEGEEDFGFYRTRLFFMPVLSGLAAVGGVLIVWLLAEAANFAPEAASTGGVSQPLGGVFNIHTFSVGLLIAAVFGMTPDLLVEKLQRKADDYRAGLTASTAASGLPTSKPSPTGNPPGGAPQGIG